MITFAVTAWNETNRGDFQWIKECLEAASEHPMIDEIVVVNDASTDIDRLRDEISRTPKLTKVVQNPVNLGVFGNKVTSVEESSGDWVVMCDSDNVMDESYFDRIAEIQLRPNRLYGPSFGQPELDYRGLVGEWTTETILQLPNRPADDIRWFWCLANTGNWIVPRTQFLSRFRDIPRLRSDLWQPDYFSAGSDRKNPHWRYVYDAADSFFINKVWWSSGGVLSIVEDLKYYHRMDKKAPGNYNRSPADKEAVSPVYYIELCDIAQGKTPPLYLYQGRHGGEFRYLNTETNQSVQVSLTTAKIT